MTIDLSGRSGKGPVWIEDRTGVPHADRRAPRRAREVPETRMEMVDDCTRLAPALAAMPWVHDTAGHAKSALHRGDFDRVEYLIGNLRGASLYYVEPDLCDLIAHAWRDVPPTTLTEDLVPDPAGVVFFAKPLIGQDADDADVPLTIHALSWMWVSLLEEAIETAIGIVTWQCMGGMSWSPMGRTDWPLDHDTDTAATALDGSAQRIASQTEDRRILATVWLLASQQRVTETTTVAIVNKAARRRYEAAHHRKPPPVNVIDLRRPRHPSMGGDEGRAVEWSRRWIVSGHWRQQAYGEGRQYRRPTWIAPFVKGPADKPLVVTETVKRLS